MSLDLKGVIKIIFKALLGCEITKIWQIQNHFIE